MTKYVINGGRQLRGSVSISGAKNAALPIIAGALLANDVCRIENVPKISDVTLMLEVIRGLGAKVRLINKSTVEIDSRGVRDIPADDDAMREMRASYYMIGVMLGRFGHAVAAMPGGCDLGVRPIDRHIKGFEALGADVEVNGGRVYASAKGGRLVGAKVYFDDISVGATINVMLAAVLAEGQTVIENSAKEPHIVDLANFLNSMGADIKGAGTDVIRIRGVESLRGVTYSIIPDQIEAGTFMAAVAATGGEIMIKNVIPKHLECIAVKFEEMGVEFEKGDEYMLVRRTGKLESTNVRTLPYPGFPTDMQPQISAVLCISEGTSMITEGIYDNRFKYMDELKRMGAKVQVDGKVAVIEGVKKLTGAKLRASDLRAGAALVIAGLCADGCTEIRNVHFTERGYEDIISKFKGLGADIERVELVEQDEMADVG